MSDFLVMTNVGAIPFSRFTSFRKAQGGDIDGTVERNGISLPATISSVAWQAVKHELARVVPSAPGFYLRIKGTPHRRPVIAWRFKGGHAEPVTAQVAVDTALELPGGEVATSDGRVLANWDEFIADFHSDAAERATDPHDYVDDDDDLGDE